METTQVKLPSPHIFDGKERSELTMRKPLVGDRIRASKMSDNKEEQESMLMARLCGVKYEDFAKMPLPSYNVFSEAFLSFFPKDDESSKTSDTASSSSDE